MSFKEIHKTALMLNKSKYFPTLCINLFLFLFFAFITVAVALSDYFITGRNTVLNDTYYINLIRISVFVILTIVSCIVLSSVSVGQTAVFFGRVNRKKASFKRIVYWLKPSKSLKAFGLSICILLLKALWTIVFMLPGSIVLSAIIYLAFTGGIEIYLFISLAVSGIALIISGCSFAFIISQRYFLARYLLSENPGLKIIQVIKQSKNLMEYQLMTVVKFKLSFVLPLFFSFFIIPIIFLYPHYKQSLSVLAKELTV